MSTTINPDTLLVQMRALAAQAQGHTGVTANATPRTEFTDLLTKALSAVDSQQQEADKLAEAFQKGDPNVQMAEVMISMQKAGISFQAMVEVRNKLVSAYQEIMNMQV
ncbi:MAG: flagellar hook-basal body complex protein FliE [Gammaproteobacteria bacterium]|nr:flagellar hook-basal body complex protein FliE [Gammaproteobacteria bacterium]